MLHNFLVQDGDWSFHKSPGGNGIVTIGKLEMDFQKQLPKKNILDFMVIFVFQCFVWYHLGINKQTVLLGFRYPLSRFISLTIAQPEV